jgi:hypothetical protein
MTDEINSPETKPGGNHVFLAMACGIQTPWYSSRCC